MDAHLIDFVVFGAAAIAIAAATVLYVIDSLKSQRDLLCIERDKLSVDIHDAHARVVHLSQQLELANSRRAAVLQMREIWGNPESSESRCHDLLHANIWVLQPEYVLPHNQKLFSRQELGTILRDLGIVVPKDPNSRWHFLERVKNDISGFPPDICGFMTKRTSVGLPYSDPGEEVFLFIELKKAGKVITHYEFDQVHNYASFFRKLPDTQKAWNTPIECLVVGHDLAPGVGDACMRWNSDTRTTITIRPVRWRDLLERAEKLCEMFMELEPASTAVD